VSESGKVEVDFKRFTATGTQREHALQGLAVPSNPEHFDLLELFRALLNGPRWGRSPELPKGLQLTPKTKKSIFKRLHQTLWKVSGRDLVFQKDAKDDEGFSIPFYKFRANFGGHLFDHPTTTMENLIKTEFFTIFSNDLQYSLQHRDCFVKAMVKIKDHLQTQILTPNQKREVMMRGFFEICIDIHESAETKCKPFLDLLSINQNYNAVRVFRNEVRLAQEEIRKHQEWKARQLEAREQKLQQEKARVVQAKLNLLAQTNSRSDSGMSSTPTPSSAARTPSYGNSRSSSRPGSPHYFFEAHSSRSTRSDSVCSDTYFQLTNFKPEQ
jgi:hypothetical protein